jgi:dihydrofolate reductase/thymidylate synthase
MMYQRSADIGLGLPFNIASYAVLTYILAKLTNLKPKKLIITLGDAHIYENHIEALEEQINRIPYNFPVLKFNPEKNDP